MGLAVVGKIPWSAFQKTIKHISGLVALIWFTNNPAIALAESHQVSPDNSINLSITTHLGENQTFHEGDEVSFLLNLDRDAYLLIVYQDAAGTLVPLFPTKDQGEVMAGDFLPFPDRNMGLRFVVQAPFGQERIWIFAASKPFPISKQENSIKDYANINALLTMVRRHGKKPDISYGEAYTQITTIKNP